MSTSPGLALYDYTFRITPIFLTGGIAGAIPGAALPIIAIFQPSLFTAITSLASSDFVLDNFFAHFRPLPGATLINQDLGRYPFANQAVAANAVIQEPLTVSMLMVTPVRPPDNVLFKFVTMQAAKAAVDQHNNSGGTYTVLTPSYPYTNGIMRRWVALPDEGTQSQNMWQLDFEFPLISLQAAVQSYNNLMGRIGAQTPLTTNAAGQIPWSGLQPTVGGDTSGSIGAPIASPAIGPSPQGALGADQSAGSVNTSPSGAPF